MTVVEAGPCPILQVKNKERDGYEAVQLGFLDARAEPLDDPQSVMHALAKAKPQKFVREIRLSEPCDRQIGDRVTDRAFSGTADLLRGRSSARASARGFQGVMKRHHFGGQPASHGTERKHRSAGVSAHRVIADSAVVSRREEDARPYGPRCASRQVNQKLVSVDKDRNLAPDSRARSRVRTAVTWW